MRGSIRIPIQYKKDGQSYIGTIVDSSKDGQLKLVDPSTNQEVVGQMTKGTVDYDTGQLDISVTDLETNSQTAVNYAYNNMSINIPVAHNGNVMRKNQIAA